MIEIEQAIKTGEEFVFKVYDKPEEVVLESAVPAENTWLVTFRVPLSIKPVNSLQNILGVNKRIFYKTVKIDEDGKVVEIVDAISPTEPSSEIQTESV